ncbi:MerR family transcriptional regulator [Salinithrix halophila]|uniref:MerR family transcriptional regulator n=1 Tax=Salinithrix halophila TaxID=1485204 RepID=A0ABV8JB49_9BACL
MDRKLYRTGEFAAKASVTVRTLRWYDRVGLLNPSCTSEAGHRLYTDADLVQLEQILALKFLGLSLEEIRECQAVGPESLTESLAVQKEMLKDRRAQIDRVIGAIEWIEKLSSGGEPDWQSIIQVIRVIQMEEKKDWWKKYYSDEAVKKLEERQKTYSEEDALQDAARWNEAIADMKKAVAEGKDPAAPEGQDIARRWWNLIEEFTMGDEEIREGLNQSYQADDGPFCKPYTAEEEAFINRALEIYKKQQGI